MYDAFYSIKTRLPDPQIQLEFQAKVSLLSTPVRQESSITNMIRSRGTSVIHVFSSRVLWSWYEYDDVVFTSAASQASLHLFF